MDVESNGTRVSIREVYGLVERVEEKLVAQVRTTEAELKAMFAKHETEHVEHASEHELDRQHRSQLWRWTVTTVLSAILGLSGWAALWLKG
jgi:F0F1-type ATP synthase membrane subunit b/b'